MSIVNPNIYPGNPINRDPDMLWRMEEDLKQKAMEAFAIAGVSANVYGVFSLDDLENQIENSLESEKISIGVQYVKGVRNEIDFKNAPPGGQTGGTSAKLVTYDFLIVLALPTNKECKGRYNVLNLLTVLRLGIQGSTIAGDARQRSWNFLAEKPEPGASSETMLFYSQVWQVALVNQGPIRN